MAAQHDAIPIIRTKLHRPPVAADIVCRKTLYTKLEEGRRLPLSLVSAPAGYGKSTLISHWLETRGCPSAWLSLGETDSDLRVFVSYVVAAVQTVSPASCQDTLMGCRALGRQFGPEASAGQNGGLAGRLAAHGFGIAASKR